MPTDSRAVRIAVWGLGGHAIRNVIPACQSANGVQLVGIYSRDKATTTEVASETGATAFRSSDEMLQSDDVDAVYIATPTGLHFDMAMNAIDAAKHVWCEKPITTSHEDTSEIVVAAANANVVALEADMFLHHPQFRELNRLMALPEVGEFHSVAARFGFPHRSTSDFRYSADLGGGALLDAGFYPIAATVGLLGDGLQLAGSTLDFDSALGIDVGGTALIAADRGAAILDWGFGRSYRSEIEVWCEGAVVALARAFAKPADLETTVSVRYQSGSVETIRTGAADQFRLMLEGFAAATKGQVPYDPKPLLERSRLITAIRDSA